MAEALKLMFDEAYFERLASEVGKVHARFPGRNFVEMAMSGLEAMELNDRMRHGARCLRTFLPGSYDHAIRVLLEVIPSMPRGYQNLIFPEFVALFGLEDELVSLDALEFFTKFGSSEFAIRHFIRRNPRGVINRMLKWADDNDEHVRRLASEGSRTRLPWSFKLDAVLADPAMTRPILEKLRQDSSLYVRKSVANHLNDLTKDHPEYVLELLGAWDLQHPLTAWIAKHACRTLIKAGHPGALALFAFESELGVSLRNFSIEQPELQLGEELVFRFELLSSKDNAQKLVVDYAVTYPKKLGGSSRKVFKLRDLQLGEGETVRVYKRQRIQDFSTRKHYAGRHGLEILVNGIVMHQGYFDLRIQ